MISHDDYISKLCIDKYKCLKKTGKPSDNEWTVLAGFVLKNNDDYSVVSIATGTKCLGANDLENNTLYNIGSRVCDSHAEVLARRALIRYLYEQINQLLSEKESNVFMFDNEENIIFKQNVSFHFYCSQTPCGDCSIILKEEAVSPPSKISKLDQSVDFSENGRIVCSDIYRTGAKCVENEVSKDLYLPGVDYHVVGPLRTKPGRGDPTLSLSCSDKLAKWNVIGVQGALLSLFIPKLIIQTITIGGGCPFSLEVMERGIFKRFNTIIQGPKIVQVSLPFPHKKSESRTHPCPSSIIWCDVNKRSLEVAVEGRKQGATKNKKGGYLLISRRALFKYFFTTVDKFKFKNIPLHPKKITYYDCKQYCSEYQKLWRNYRLTIFNSWPSKPLHLQTFSL